MNVKQKLESMASLRNLLWNSTAPITIRLVPHEDAIVAADPDPVRIYSIL